MISIITGIKDPCFETENSSLSDQFFHYIYVIHTKGRLSYHLCVEYFSQLSFDSEMYTKSAAVADFIYISESNESWEKYSTQR